MSASATTDDSDLQPTKEGSSDDNSYSSSNTNYYLDADATGTGTGLSVENAFTSFAAVAASGFGRGDTLWISGGSTSKTYSLSADYWCPSGTTYKVNQQEGHNGLVIIDSGDIPKFFQIRNRSDITIDGEVDGERHIRFQNWATSPGFVAVVTSGSGTEDSSIDSLSIRYIEIISDDATCETQNCSDIAVRYYAYLNNTGGGALIEDNYFEGCCMNFSP